jgi:aspartate racemase
MMYGYLKGKNDTIIGKEKRSAHMRTIGLLGGMSWESTLEYYRIINQGVKARLGGSHSAQCLLYSVDFAEIEALQHTGNWEALTAAMIAAVKRLERGGADCLVICTNTMHRMAGEVQASTPLPLLHIADATAAAVKAQGLHSVGLLGTRFTMQGDFYRGRLERQHGLQVLVPDQAGIDTVHRIIYDELILGIIHEDSHQAYLNVIADLAARGAQGVILGCTEIPLLVKQSDVPIPVFDTTAIHAQAAVKWALRV